MSDKINEIKVYVDFTYADFFRIVDKFHAITLGN